MFVISWICFLSVSQEELGKELFGTTLPARLEKFNALLKGPFFLGDKVRYPIVYLYKLSETQGVVDFKIVWLLLLAFSSMSVESWCFFFL